MDENTIQCQVRGSNEIQILVTDGEVWATIQPAPQTTVVVNTIVPAPGF